jgi:hypothetical protein
VKKLVLLATVALVAMLILVPTAMAQTDTDTPATPAPPPAPAPPAPAPPAPLPQTGGPLAPLVLLPTTVLLLGSGVVAYALVRRR